MKMLNKNGVKKLNDYINSVYGKVFEAHDDILTGPKSDKVFEDLKKHGIIFEQVVESNDSNGPYRVMVEEMPGSSVAPIDAGKSAVVPSSTETDYDDDKKLKSLVSKILPYLAQHFPNKEEVNNALNDLRGQLIDPAELTKLFKDMSVNVKKSQAKLSK